MAEDDIVWRRSTRGTESPQSPPDYPGPPVGKPADARWHPPYREPMAAPRPLPWVDHDAVDDAEARATRFTYAIGLSALTVLLTITCSRLF